MESPNLYWPDAEEYIRRRIAATIDSMKSATVKGFLRLQGDLRTLEAMRNLPQTLRALRTEETSDVTKAQR